VRVSPGLASLRRTGGSTPRVLWARALRARVRRRGKARFMALQERGLAREDQAPGLTYQEVVVRV
jgi:hypothetical protein